MSRWHKTSCKYPHIVVEGEIPRCTACDTYCPLQELVDKQILVNAIGTLPRNEPSGHLNLSWPPSVPYSKRVLASSPSAGQSLEDAAVEEGKSETENSSVDPLQPDRNPLSEEQQAVRPVDSPVYESSLASDEIRLVCLTVAEHENIPVHLCLETHNEANCPDYETVSYTWGGEDGDSTMSRPIFVGPFWDVTFQTKNCWEMLRFIRPSRGIRLAWIDALCINQNNIEERSQQVAKMTQIYQQCSRVIVYLGTDIIRNPSAPFPPRNQLDNIEGFIHLSFPESNKDPSRAQLSFQELLQRRYFSRVWVIQELVVTQRAIIRIDDTDFLINSSVNVPSASHWSSDQGWDATAAPWLQYMAKKTIQSDDLFKVLSLTSNSRASDPRDRLYGVLGIIRRDREASNQWQPDYSLSSQHLFIGLLAYFITNLRMPHILLHAAGLSASASSPSWVPAWESDESWRSVFTTVEFDHQGMPNFVRQLRSPDQDCSLFNLHRDPETTFASGLGRLHWIDKAFEQKPWHTDMIIDSNTGALSIYLTHFCTIPSIPTAVGSLGKWTIFEVRGSRASLFLASQDPLDTVISSTGQYGVFILNPVNSSSLSFTEPSLSYMEPYVSENPGFTYSGDSSFIYLILRKVRNGEFWTLVATCPSMVVRTDSSGPSSVVSEPRIDTLFTTVQEARLLLEKDIYGDKYLRLLNAFFPDAKTGWDLFPVYCGIVNEHDGSSPSFEASYLSSVNGTFKPQITDGFLQLKIPLKTNKTYEDLYVGDMVIRPSSDNPEISLGSWEKRTKTGQWESVKTFSLDLKDGEKDGKKDGMVKQIFSIQTLGSGTKNKIYPQIYLRIPLESVRKAVVCFFTLVERIRHALKTDVDGIVAILKSSPDDVLHCVGCPDFPEMVDDFEIDGSTRQIHLL